MGIISGALGALGGIMGGSAVKGAAKANDRLLKRLQTEGMGYIDNAYNESKGYLGDAQNIWKGLSDASGGLSGLDMYANALGLNGASGNAAATSAFQTGPGYQFQLDSGLDALERRAASQGRLSSGQTGLDTINYASGLANQEYQNWLSNLMGYGTQQANLYTTGLTGQAGSLSDLANLATGTGDRKTNLLSEVTNGRMGVNNQIAAGTQQQWGGGLSGLASGLGSVFGGWL